VGDEGRDVGWYEGFTLGLRVNICTGTRVDGDTLGALGAADGSAEVGNVVVGVIVKILIGVREVGKFVNGNCEIRMLLGKSVDTGNAIGDEIGIWGVDCSVGTGDD